MLDELTMKHFAPVFYVPIKRLDMPSVCRPGPPEQDAEQSVSSRILRLGVFDHHGERKNVF
jgi:hypothetical protein